MIRAAQRLISLFNGQQSKERQRWEKVSPSSFSVFAGCSCLVLTSVDIRQRGLEGERERETIENPHNILVRSARSLSKVALDPSLGQFSLHST